MISKVSCGAIATAACAILSWPSPAAASERHFTYTYESNVLNPGDVELEPWTTWRTGRMKYYSRWDHRLEFELGVVKNLQVALYWNYTTLAADGDTVVDPITNESVTLAEDRSSNSASLELKYKLSDSVADAVGTAAYFEGTLGPREAALEAKFILDKRVGDLLLAANLVFEPEWEFEPGGETAKEMEFELDLGGAYFLSESVSLGLELRSVTELEQEEEPSGEKAWETETSVIYAGPVVGYSTEKWWTALTFMPQLAAIKGSSDGSRLDLDHQERYQTRLIVGLHL